MADAKEDQAGLKPQKNPRHAINYGAIVGVTGIAVGLGGILMVMKAFVAAGFNGNIATILLKGATPTDYLMFMGLLIIHVLPLYAVFVGIIYLPYFMSEGYTPSVSRSSMFYHRKHGYGKVQLEKVLLSLIAIAFGIFGILLLYDNNPPTHPRNFYILTSILALPMSYIVMMTGESASLRRAKRRHSLDIIPLLRTQKVKWEPLRETFENENRRRLLLYMNNLLEAEQKIKAEFLSRRKDSEKSLHTTVAIGIAFMLSWVSVFGTPGLWLPWEVIEVRHENSLTKHVAQQVNHTEIDSTFYLPYENKIFRLNVNEIESREYCVPRTTYVFAEYGLQACKKP